MPHPLHKCGLDCQGSSDFPFHSLSLRVSIAPCCAHIPGFFWPHPLVLRLTWNIPDTFSIWRARKQVMVGECHVKKNWLHAWSPSKAFSRACLSAQGWRCSNSRVLELQMSISRIRSRCDPRFDPMAQPYCRWSWMCPQYNSTHNMIPIQLKRAELAWLRTCLLSPTVQVYIVCCLSKSAVHDWRSRKLYIKNKKQKRKEKKTWVLDNI